MNLHDFAQWYFANWYGTAIFGGIGFTFGLLFAWRGFVAFLSIYIPVIIMLLAYK